ncbi:MAG TPA: phenylalanine--tRNA ligase subunit alpha [Candidatus Dormibacteraeota bacterium]|nr:phenylalanine--tRNA ligase subunit alpha [Candidatus Dormibacteraeota bacterium]
MSLPNIKQILPSIQKAATEKELEQLRVKYLGRNGVITAELRRVGSLPALKKAQAGKEANLLKHQAEAAIRAASKRLEQERVESELSDVKLDVTAPVGAGGWGHHHPVTELIDDIVKVFWQMGFVVAEGPEIETPWYNFDALNISPDHPARDMQDTFYLEGGNLPRTHTSSVQIRYMEQNKPPIRIISPGKAYRNEDEDASHVWMFYQVEGLVVDRGITLSDLKGTLLAMMRGILGEDTGIRLRPSFFPYTEPSVEVDATCVICKGKGCRTCGNTGWLELGGAGMVHPQVLINVGIDPEEYTGFAFGFGLERIAAIKHQVPDIREFWRPNLKFLEQF